MTTDKGHLPCFKAYDIRGRIPDELNVDLVRDVGRAYAKIVGPRRVAVGRDVRLSSPEMSQAVIEGLTGAGVDVVDIGLCGTEEVYFATFHLKLDGGVMVTASHNPMDYNGMKLVRQEARPISADTGLREIEAAVLDRDLPPSTSRGKVEQLDVRDAYVDHVLGMVETESLQPLEVVVNPGHGCAGPVLDLLEERLPFTLRKIYYEPDGTFPAGIPNPLLEENRDATASAVRDRGAALGVAWDGDFDRCFVFDETGGFIEGYYIVGLLASQILRRHPGAKIIHDPRLVWNTIEMVQEMGGVPVQSKSGHAFIKERMRAEDAVYGGEMSAHHYFREFSYCDSGMVPWLLVAQAMGASGKSLSELVAERMQRYPTSGEINRRVPDADEALKLVLDRYKDGARLVERVDGISVELADWRLNLRKSNTEPVVRLNVESRGDEQLMRDRTAEVLRLLEEAGAVA